jgi:hypothetical protein
MVNNCCVVGCTNNVAKKKVFQLVIRRGALDEKLLEEGAVAV